MANALTDLVAETRITARATIPLLSLDLLSLATIATHLTIAAGYFGYVAEENEAKADRLVVEQVGVAIEMCGRKFEGWDDEELTARIADVVRANLEALTLLSC